jgi:hypothetical protein
MCICITTTATTINENTLCLARQEKVEKEDTAMVLLFSATENGEDTAMVSFSASEMEIFEEELNCITATAFNEKVLCLVTQFSASEMEIFEEELNCITATAFNKTFCALRGNYLPWRLTPWI